VKVVNQDWVFLSTRKFKTLYGDLVSHQKQL